MTMTFFCLIIFKREKKREAAEGTTVSSGYSINNLFSECPTTIDVTVNSYKYDLSFINKLNDCNHLYISVVNVITFVINITVVIGR